MNEMGGTVGVYHKTEIWIEDVMNYFGEYVDEKQAIELLKEAGRLQEGFFGTMHEIRRILIERGHSVPFRAVYRRIKDE